MSATPVNPLFEKALTFLVVLLCLAGCLLIVFVSPDSLATDLVYRAF
jgi:hypothetical protein